MATVQMNVSHPTNVLEMDVHDALNDVSPKSDLQSASVNKTPPAAPTPPVGRYNSVSKTTVLKLTEAQWIDMCGKLAGAPQTLTIEYNDGGPDPNHFEVLDFSFKNTQ